MASNVISLRLRAANDNLPGSTGPNREAQRIGIMLDWWERELRGLLADRPARRSFSYRAWRIRLDEAQSRVSEFRGRIGEVA